MDTWIISAIGIAGTLLGVYITGRLNRQTYREDRQAAIAAENQRWIETQQAEHEVWLRSQKQEAYWEYIEACLQALPEKDRKREFDRKAFIISLSKTLLHGSGRVQRLASQLHNKTKDLDSLFQSYDPKAPDAQEKYAELNKISETIAEATAEMWGVMREDLGIKE